MKMEHGHIYRPFDVELQALKDAILAMGGVCEQHIAQAMRALVERNPDLAAQVVEEDREVNRMELAIDEQCLRLLALRQPAASDLRFIAAALKIVTDLERIGDLTVNIAQRARALSQEPPIPAVVDLPQMATAAQKMLRDALDAFVTKDARKAEQILAADDQIDRWLTRVFEELREEMERDPTMISRGISALFLAKAIERLADHTTNVAEMVVFLVRGKDVRHAGSR